MWKFHSIVKRETVGNKFKVWFTLTDEETNTQDTTYVQFTGHAPTKLELKTEIIKIIKLRWKEERENRLISERREIKEALIFLEKLKSLGIKRFVDEDNNPVTYRQLLLKNFGWDLDDGNDPRPQTDESEFIIPTIDDNDV